MTDEPTDAELAAARTLLRECAIEMYVSDGLTQPEAEVAADKLLNSPAQFQLPTLDQLDAMSPSDRLLAAGRAADDDMGEDLSHLTLEQMAKKLSN